MSAPVITDMSLETEVLDDWKNQKALQVKQKLESLLFSSGEIKITNKIQRNVKKMFNEMVNLTDKMFQGFHTDGSIIGSLSNDELEIKMLYNVLKKTPTLSFQKAKKTITTWMKDYVHDTESSYPSKKHELIVRAYEKYVEEVNSKKVTVKTRGLDLTEQCWKYWGSDTVDPILEEQINKTCDELYSLISSSFDETFTASEFIESIVPVLDISGSMSGVPIQTGLFYLLVLVKVFGLKTIHYFESEHHVTNIESGWETNLDLIKQIYRDTLSSTCLDCVFTYFNSTKISNKNVIIITDSDCDPSHYGGTINPFHEVTRLDKDASMYPNVIDCNFIVVNVKESDLKFPYLDLDPRVCYLTGNNPKTINGFIKALCESSKNETMITPDLILKYSLSIPELNLEFPVPKLSKIMTDDRIATLFTVFQKNLPPKKMTIGENTGEMCDSIEPW